MTTEKMILNFMRKALMLLCAFVIMGAVELMAQEKIPVSLKCDNVSLKTALDKIASQTDFKFIYTDKVKANEIKVTFDCSNEPLEAVLSKILNPLEISYVIRDNHVILSTLQKSDTINGVSSKEVLIKGVVQDEAGEPLPGASVENTRTEKFAASDIDGVFRIEGAEGDLIKITSIGMKDRTFRVGDAARDYKIILEQSSIALSDVVVTGYQTLSKERSTGSYAVVTSQKLEKKLQPSLASVLEGQSAGVVLTKDGKIEVRGVSTFNGTQEPLIVVDGYPLIGDGMGLESINSDNIENITVLKDAVAASIYGARASNGVIVITTKSAKKGAVSVGYKGTYSIVLKPDFSKLNMASPADYMDAELDLYQANPSNYFSQYNRYRRISEYMYLLMAKDRGLIPAADADKQIEMLRGNNSLEQIGKYLIKPKQSHSHNLSISGGSDKNMFHGAIRYIGEYGNLKHNNSSRFIADINNNWKPTDWFSFRIFTNINYFKQNSSVETWKDLANVSGFGKIDPYTRMYDESGNAVPFMPVGQRRIDKYNTYHGMKPVTYHPESDLGLHGTTSENLQVRLGGDINVKFFDFLSGSVGGAWVKGSTTSRTIADISSFAMRTAYNDGTSATNPAKHYIPDGGKIDENRGTIMSWVIRAQLNYNQTFDNKKHRVTAMLGSEISKDTYERSFLPTRLGYDPVSATYDSGFNIHEYRSNTNNISGDMLFGRRPDYLGSVSYGNNYGVRDNRFVSWYGNASYEFNNRYQITGSIRLDLTNFFGTDPKFRYKPTWSVGGAYRISEEEFFSGIKDIFNRFNIRASYGINGNISLNNTPYLVLNVGNYSPIMGGVSNGINTYPNNQLRWEKTRITDIGLDFSMINNRLNVGFDFYNKKSTDLIVMDQVDETKGMGSLNQNVGGVTNRGFELSVSGDILKGENSGFLWNSSLIANYNTSRVDYYNLSRPYFESYAGSAIMVQGYSMDAFWGGRFAGLDNTGNPLYYNSKGEKVEGGMLKAEDAVYLGTVRPPLDLSWTNSFSYNAWELSFMFIGKFGHKYRKDSFYGSNYNNRHVAERWRNPGDEATRIYPKLDLYTMNAFYYPYSDHLTASASYVKLRDLTLTYNFQRGVLSKLRLSGLKIYFQTRNLFYITAKGVDIDPETIDNFGGYDSVGAFSVGGLSSMQLRPEFYFGISVNL